MLTFKLFLFGLSALAAILDFATATEKIINCYWGTWSHYRPGDGAYKIENIDPNLCTHLSYTFLGINDKGEVQTLDGWLDLPTGLNNIAKAVGLKKINPKLKVLAVVGGWNEGSAKYSQMAADPSKRKNFVRTALKFIEEHGFDGLDLDWEYPARRDGSSPADKQNFVTLLKEIHQALKAKKYLFGIAVGASEEIAKTSYDLSVIHKYLDFINVMTYDFSTWFDGFVGYNAPLRGQGSNNVETSIKYWISQGVPANKLVMGLAFYGHTYKLANSKQFGEGSPINGPGAQGPYTRQAGFLGYNEICTNKGSYSYKWNEKEGVPVLYSPSEVVSYDDEKSIALKVDLANSLNLAGVMIWSIETDDFHGFCGTKNVLLKTINNKMGKPQDMSPSGNEHLNAEQPAKPSVSKPNNQSPSTKPNNKPADAGNCSEDGLFPAPDCTNYIQCSTGVAYTMLCPSGLHFDAEARVCNWPEAANCY